MRTSEARAWLRPTGSCRRRRSGGSGRRGPAAFARPFSQLPAPDDTSADVSQALQAHRARPWRGGSLGRRLLLRFVVCRGAGVSGDRRGLKMGNGNAAEGGRLP